MSFQFKPATPEELAARGVLAAPAQPAPARPAPARAPTARKPKEPKK